MPIALSVRNDVHLLEEGGNETGTCEEGGLDSWHGCWGSCRSWSVRGRRWNISSASWVGDAGSSWVVASADSRAGALWLAVNDLSAWCWSRRRAGTLWLAVNVLGAADWGRAAGALWLPVDVLGADWHWCTRAALRLPVYVLGADDWDHAALRLAVNVLGALHRHG